MKWKHNLIFCIFLRLAEIVTSQNIFITDFVRCNKADYIIMLHARICFLCSFRRFTGEEDKKVKNTGIAINDFLSLSVYLLLNQRSEWVPFHDICVLEMLERCVENRCVQLLQINLYLPCTRQKSEIQFFRWQDEASLLHLRQNLLTFRRSIENYL